MSSELSWRANEPGVFNFFSHGSNLFFAPNEPLSASSVISRPSCGSSDRINTQRAPSFPYDPTLLSILRIQPSLSPSFALNSSLPSLPYSSMITSEIWSFTFLDFLATSGGVLTASVFFYSLLWGQRRLDPWGMMQRVVFRSVPVALPLPEADEEKTGKRGCWSAWECGADKDERKGSGDSAANGDAVVVHAGDSPFELRSRTTSRETTVDLDLPPIPPPDPDPEPQTPTKMFRSPLSEHPSIEIPELPTPNSSSTFASTNPLLPSPPQTPLDERDARAALGDPLQSSESLRQDLHHRLLPLHLTNGTTTHGTVGSRTVDVDARVRGELLKFGELLGRYYLADVLDVRLAEGR